MSNAFLGIDTSAYRTSAALVFDNGEYISERELLKTPKGEIGLRQSDALFQHIKTLPIVLSRLPREGIEIKAVGVSVSPTNEKGSYMPVFMAGMLAAEAASFSANAPLYKFSHQQGHIRAAMMNKSLDFPFLAFHISGGTTECLRVEENFKCVPLNKSLDLKAGQAIDRLGVLLGMDFPAGGELEKIALKSQREFKIKPFFRDGNPSLSGLQNKCEKMLENGESPEDTARFMFLYIAKVLSVMMEYNQEDKALFSGGVTENKIIRECLEGEGRIFAPPELSGDNAVGIAALAGDEYGKRSNNGFGA